MKSKLWLMILSILIWVSIVQTSTADGSSDQNVTITIPTEGQKLNTSDINVTGTASVNVIRVEVSNENGNWQIASGNSSWKATVTLPDGSNTIHIRAIDIDENIIGETSVNVTMDTTLPDIRFTSPINDEIFSTPSRTVTLTASDNDLSNVDVKVGNGDWQAASLETLWNASVTLSEGSNPIYARAFDTAGNIGTTSVNVTLNTQLVTITINSGAEYTNRTEVTLSLTSPNARWMSFSNDYSNWTNWEPFASSKSWTLSSADALKLVHFSVSNRTDIRPDQGLTSEDSIILDTTRPEVTDLKVSTSTPELNKPVDITAKVSDNYPDTSNTFFFVISPDGNRSKCTTGIYRCNFINTSGYGRYDVSISASDLAGNANNIEKTWFITTMKPYDRAVSTVKNNITEINALDEVNTTLELLTTQNIDGNIRIILSNDIPPEINQSIGSIPFGKFIAISTDNPDLEKNLNWMNIKIHFTEEELKASGLDENSLRIFYFNKSSNMWETAAGGVNTAGTGNFSGYVWANVSVFSTFELAGSYPTSKPGTSGGGSSSSGGGGGGGGGASGEKYTNIEAIEKYDLYIFKNKITEYKFKGNNNPILFLNITGNANAGEITAIVEVLRNTSYLVKTQAPGFVYKNMNIWVGNLGFSNSKNIKQAIIEFRVENSWLERNNLEGNGITLAKWNGIEWITLETSRKKMDSTFTYFDANTDSFSPFAITALKGTDPLPAVISSTDKDKAPVPVEKVEQPERKQFDFLMNWFFIIGIFLIIGLIVEIIIRMKNK